MCARKPSHQGETCTTGETVPWLQQAGQVLALTKEGIGRASVLPPPFTRAAPFRGPDAFLTAYKESRPELSASLLQAIAQLREAAAQAAWTQWGAIFSFPASK